MKNCFIKQFILIVFISCFISCQIDEEIETPKNHFPFSESEMITQNSIGTLLEYAIFDTSNIEFVENIICDTLKSKENYVFSKIELETNDSTFFFYSYKKREYPRTDYIGMIYLDIDKPDTISMYSYDWKYHIDDFEQIMKEIAERNNCSEKDVLQHRKMGNYFIPKIYFFIDFNSMDCSTNFLRKVVRIEKKINSLFKNYIQSKFKDEIILVKPYIELRLKE